MASKVFTAKVESPKFNLFVATPLCILTFLWYCNRELAIVRPSSCYCAYTYKLFLYQLAWSWWPFPSSNHMISICFSLCTCGASHVIQRTVHVRRKLVCVRWSALVHHCQRQLSVIIVGVFFCLIHTLHRHAPIFLLAWYTCHFWRIQELYCLFHCAAIVYILCMSARFLHL